MTLWRGILPCTFASNPARPSSALLLDTVEVDLELDFNGIIFLGPVQTQDAVRRDLTCSLGELKIILVLLALPFGTLSLLAAVTLPVSHMRMRTGPRSSAASAMYSARICCDACLDVVGCLQVLVGIDQALNNSSRLPAAAASGCQIAEARGSSPFSRAAVAEILSLACRQIEIFEPLRGIGVQDGLTQIVAELALRFNAFQDGLLAVSELALKMDANPDLPKHVFRQAAGSLSSIACDERDGVAFVEQLDRAFNLQLANLQVLGDAREIQGRCFVHG